MLTLMNLVAKLDYPSAPVMLLATVAISGFIFGGGYWFKRADERARAERAALKAAATSPTNGKPTNP